MNFDPYYIEDSKLEEVLKIYCKNRGIQIWSY
jgi:hypothetical protein